MPRSVTAAFRQALMAERTGDVIATLLTIASRDRYEAAVLKSKPVGYWRLGEIAGQTTLWDVSGKAHHGTYFGGVTLEQDGGMLDGDLAALFDGVDDRALVAHHADFASAAFSIELRVKATGPLAGFRRPISKGLQAAPGWEIQVDGSGQHLELRLDTSAGTNQLFQIPSVFDGAFHRLLWTVDPVLAVVTKRKDGALVAIENWSVGTGLAGNTTDLNIGRQASTGNHFPGLLDEIALYDRVLASTDDTDHQTALAKTTIPTIRVTDHKPDVVSRGRKYLSFPYEFIWPDDSEDSPPVARLRISNVSRTIVEGLRLVGSGHRLTVTGEMLRVAAPDVVEVAFPKLDLLHATATASVIEGDLGVRLTRARRYPKQRFLPSTHPGVF